MTSNKNAGMIRARVRREGRAVELGYFKTKAEVAAAQQVAHAILDELDEIKKKPLRLPSPEVLVKMIGQGRYDSGIELIAQIATRRTDLVKSMTSSRDNKYGTLAQDPKWQALKDIPKEDAPKKSLADELKSLGFDPAIIGPYTSNKPKQKKSLGLDPPSHLIG
tara:strand:- start:57 stop:548 length:492 start_codon:yes stop_codon:yes gene_type:complete